VRLEEGFAGSRSGAGLGSRAGAFRFLDGAGGRVDEAAEEAPVEIPDGSEELAACLAAARVILGVDMSMWYLKSAFRCLQHFTTEAVVMQG
jgi:hypothetical protein